MDRINLAEYTIPQAVPLEEIARLQLGDASRWPELATLNRLRYPFISENPVVLAGDMLGRTTLRRYTLDGSSSSLLPTDGRHPSGTTVLQVADDLDVRHGERILLVRREDTGAVTGDLLALLGAVRDRAGIRNADPAVAARYDASTIGLWPAPPLLVLDIPTAYSWGAGHTLTIHPDPAKDRLRVLSPGQVLMIPVRPSSTTTVRLEGEIAARLLGTDIAANEEGQLALDDNGDLLLVSGIANLSQAIRHRLLTVPRELPLHPDYGNGALLRLGHSEIETLAMMHAESRQAAASDPRIGSLGRSSARWIGDAVAIDLSAIVQNTAQLVSVQSVIKG